MKRINDSIIFEPGESLRSIADQLRGHVFSTAVMPAGLFAEFNNSPYRESISRACSQISWIDDYTKLPMFRKGVTMFKTSINGKTTDVRIHENHGNGNFTVERLSDGQLFKVSGQTHVNSLIPVRS